VPGVAARTGLALPGRALLALVLIWLALFAPQIFRGQTFVLGDSRVYRPFAEFSRARWNELHERTFWNPYVFGGLPASASLADQRPQYLPDFALDLFERLRPARLVPLGGPLLAHLAGMLATALLARLLFGAGASGMVVAGAAWGLMPGLLVPFVYGHHAQLVSSSLIPVVLLGVHAVARAGSARAAWGAALALAFILSLQTLTGHPQFVVYTGMLAVAFALERVITSRRPGRLIPLATAALLAACMAMAVWWPALLYGAHSFRGGLFEQGVGLEEVGRFSLAWRELLALGWPQAVGGQGATYWGGLIETDFPRFVGTSVLAFAVVGVFRTPVRRGDAVMFFAVVSISSIALALGTRLGPVYPALYRFVPFFSMFRVPSAGLIAAQLGVALLAARPFSDGGDAERAGDDPQAAIARRAGKAGGSGGRATQPAPPRGPHGSRAAGGEETKRPRRALSASTGAMACAALVLVAVAIGLMAGGLDGLYARRMRAARPDRNEVVARRAARLAGLDLAGRTALLVLALVLVRARRSRPDPGPPSVPRDAGRGRRGAALAGAGAVALVIVDLGTVSWPPLARGTGPPQRLEARTMPALARIGFADPTVRVFSTRHIVADPSETVAKRSGLEFSSNDWIYWRARALGGDHGALPDRWRFSGNLTHRYAAVCALGVGFMSADPGPAWDASQFERVYEDSSEVVYRLRGALGRAYTVSTVVAPGNDLAVNQAMMSPRFDPRRVALAADPGPEGVYPGSPQCSVRWLEDSPDRIALETDAPDAAFLVIADTHFPGWRAWLDGRSVPVHRINMLQRGVALPAGRHRLDMRYTPAGWTLALPVTRWAMLAWGLAAAAWLVAGRARPRATTTP
jgi:hypothetical protein